MFCRFSFNILSCHSYFQFFPLLLAFLSTLPYSPVFILRLPFSSTWNQCLFFPCHEGYCSCLLPDSHTLHPFYALGFQIWEVQVSSFWIDWWIFSLKDAPLSGYPTFFFIIFNRFSQVTKLPHIELVRGYSPWSIHCFVPSLNLKSFDWCYDYKYQWFFWPFSRIKMLNKWPREVGRIGCTGKLWMHHHCKCSRSGWTGL